IFEFNLVEHPPDEWKPVPPEPRSFRHQEDFLFRAQTDTPVSNKKGERSRVNLSTAPNRSRPGAVGMFVNIGKYLVTREDYLVGLDLLQTGRRRPSLAE